MNTTHLNAGEPARKIDPELGSSEYRERYASPELIAWLARHRSTATVVSAGNELYLEVYAQPAANAPVFLMNHGGGGYSRLLATIVPELFDRGYTVVLPDQRGQGYSGGDRGDFVIDDLVADIVAAFDACCERFTGPVAIGGASFGGALAYMAAAAVVTRASRGGADITARDHAQQLSGVVCHNLFDLGDARDALGLSHLAPLRNLPGFARCNALLLRAICSMPFLRRLRVPFAWLGNFRTMVDERDAGFYELWLADPLPLRRVSLRYLQSVGSSPPAIRFEDNRLPVLVINPTRDLMTPPEITERNFRRLGGPARYATLDYGHWSVSAKFAREWAQIVDHWLRSEFRSGAPLEAN